MIHISDVHFSRRTSHAQNVRVMESVLERVGACGKVDVICVTGDLVSRKVTNDSVSDALLLMQKLREKASVCYSLGNHEMDWEEEARAEFLQHMEKIGITVLDNRTETIAGITFAGLTLPQTVYKNPDGSYRKLAPITREMVTDCLGDVPAHPCVLLAHTPLGFPAYAAWGADAVLSGHVHGGIVRVGGVGLLSPERRFLPKFTKGIFSGERCMMNVSAGIGKFRVNNPAEVVCIDLMQRSGRQEV